MPEVPNRRGVDMVLPPVYSPKREYPFAGPACAGECQPLDVSPILLEEEAALTGAVLPHRLSWASGRIEGYLTGTVLSAWLARGRPACF